MSTHIGEFGAFVVEDSHRDAEFKFRDGELWVQIEGTGYDGDYGSVISMSVEDARELLKYLQKEIPQ